MVGKITRAAAVSGLAFVLLTAIIGRHVISSAGSVIANDPGDPVLNAAILAWNATHIPWTDAWYQFPIFYPAADVLTMSEHLLGVSAIASPIYWLTGNALTAYNLTLLLSYPLAGLAMYALVWRLTRSSAAAFLSGLAFAFAPYRASHLPHIQVLSVFLAPLALLGLHGFVAAGPPMAEPALRRYRWLALFAICWLLQGAANGYFLVFFSVLVALWVLWFVVARHRWNDLLAIGVATAIAMLPLAPILYRYYLAHQQLGLSRNLGEIASFGADIAAPLCAPAALSVWGWLRVACGAEGELFPGVALIALCAIGIATRARVPSPPGSRSQPWVRVLAAGAIVFTAIALSSVVAGPWRVVMGPIRASVSSPDKPLSVAVLFALVAFLLSNRFRRLVVAGETATFYLLAAIVCWVLSWGPFPRLFGAEALYQAPYAWLMRLPGVDNLRTPARFWMMSVVCLCVFAGLTLAPLAARLAPSRRRAVIAVAALALLADGWATIPVAPIEIDATATSHGGRPVLMLPAGDVEADTRATLAAVTHGYRTINGYSGYEPPHYEALRTLSQQHDAALFEPFRHQDLDVIVRADDVETRTLVEQQPGALVASVTGKRLVFRIPADRPARPIAPAPAGERLPNVHPLAATCSPESSALATDGNIETRWVCGVQDSDQQITFDLGGVSRVGSIVHALGTTAADFPRELIVETSDDNARWTPAWQGSPAARVLLAALDAPRAARVVIAFEPRDARYIRLRQIGRHERNYWSIAEFEVWTGQR